MNIAEGKNIDFTTYIRNPEYTVLGPATYPNGLPLLLAGVYTLYGNSITAFLTLISLFYILYGWVSFLVLRTEIKPLAALLLCLLIMLNPPLLELKGEIMSDIPFAFFFLISIYLLRKADAAGGRYNVILLTGAALCASYATFTRSIGWALILGTGLYYISRLLQDKRAWRSLLLFITIAVTAFIALRLTFPAEAENSYLGMLEAGNLGNSLGKNADTYSRILRDIFPVYHPMLGFLQVIIGAVVISFSLLGFYQDLKSHRSIYFWILTAYASAGLFFTANIYFRFFLPVLPVLLLYTGRGLKIIGDIFPGLYRLALAMLIIPVIFSAAHASRIMKGGTIPPGPQKPEAQEVFNFLQKHAGEEETINFIKPRALALYTNLSTFSNHPQQELSSVENAFEKYNVRWLMTGEDLPNRALERYIEIKQPEMVFKNAGFTVYRLRK